MKLYSRRSKFKRISISTLVFVLIFQLCLTNIPLLPSSLNSASIGVKSSTNFVYADSQTTEQIIFDGTQSSWAEQTLIAAFEAGLTYPTVMNHYTKAITREEFATVAVKLYEKLSATKVTAGETPFTDTANPEIVKAFQLGIVLGTAPGKFSPSANIKRQEMASMIMRALSVSVPNLKKPAAEDLPFSDKGSIASWALESVKFSYQNKIINGMGDNKFAPLAKTTREQAISIIKRAYDNFSGTAIKAIVRLGTGAPPITNEITKFKDIDFSNRLTAPDYDTRLTLFAATAPGKPASRISSSSNSPVVLAANKSVDRQNDLIQGYSSLQGALVNVQLPSTVFQPINPIIQPVNPGLIINPIILNPTITRPSWWNAPRSTSPVYSKADLGAFIDWSKDKKRYFSFDTNNAPSAVNVVWQVSRTPFNGFKDNWQTPRGLVSQGTVPISEGEFVIDFGTFAPAAPGTGGFYKLNANALSFTLINRTASTFKEIPQTQYKYYVRAVPVNSIGVPIGDPGEGIEVLYGKPISSTHAEAVSPSFELWSGLRAGALGGMGEFPNLVQKNAGIGMTPVDPTYWFQLKTPASNTTKVVMQVSTEKFTSDTETWDAPSGLVYSKSYAMPILIDKNYPNAVSIAFNSFSPPASSLAADEFVDYYVRAVSVRPSTTPGAEEVAFSSTISAKYGTPSGPTLYRNETIEVPSYTPSISIVHYEPVKWENPYWTHYYEVFQNPKWNEVNSMFKNQNGAILAPYSMYTMSMSPYYDKTMTIDKYENDLVPKFLTEGTKVYFPPPVEADKSWWEELWDGIVNFFSDLVNVVKGIVNWVSNAYNSVKTGLISFVASNFPGIPDSWRAGLKAALELLVNSGLAAMGIPPSLPNFDELTSMSIDYMAGVAMTQAGIPGGPATDALLDKTKEGIQQGLASAAKSAMPNPINSTFLKADSAYLYRPAYIDVQVSNDFDKPSLPGSFSIDAEWQWTENVSLNADVWADESIAQQYADAASYQIHFVYGLSRGHQGFPIYYPIFEPVRSQPIPALQPGEKIVVRIYLKEYIGKPYPFTINGDTVLPEDFAQMYFGTTGTTNVYSGGQTVSEGYNSRFKVYVDSDYNLPTAAAAAKAMGLTGTDPKCIYDYKYILGNQSESFEQIASNPYK